MKKTHTNEVNSAKYKKAIQQLLYSAEGGRGKFCDGNRLESAPLPGLHFEGLGPINIPLIASQAKEIAKICEPLKTANSKPSNNSTCKSWQLSPSRFQITNPKWNKFIQTMKSQVLRDLGNMWGLEIDLRLNKLLLFETDGFLKPYTEAKKTENTFGTFVIQLPTFYEGGQFTVRNSGEEHAFDFGGKESNYDYSHVSFFSDSEFQVLPIKTGCQLNLMYDVVYVGTGSPPKYEIPFSHRLSQLFSIWQADKQSEKPEKMILIFPYREYHKIRTLQDLSKNHLAITQLLSRIPGYEVYIGEMWIEEDDYRKQMEFGFENLIDMKGQAAELPESCNGFSKNEIVNDDYLKHLKLEDYGLEVSSEEDSEDERERPTERSYNRIAVFWFPKKSEPVVSSTKRAKKS